MNYSETTEIKHETKHFRFRLIVQPYLKVTITVHGNECYFTCVPALLEALLTGMGVSVHTLAPLLVTICLVKMGVRHVQKKNGLQISANAK